MYKKNITLNYLFELLYSTQFIRTLWPTYLVVKGFSLIEVGMCESIFHVASFLAEMPTGIISDLYGRKISRVIGALLHIVEILLLVYATNIFMVFLSFTISAISYTCESGSNSALIYDSLQADGVAEQFRQVNAKREIVFQVGSLLSVIGAGFLANMNYDYAFYATILLVSVATIFLFMMKEAPYVKTQKQGFFKDVKQQFTLSIEVFKTNKKVQTLTIYGAVCSAIATSSFYYSTIYWQANNINVLNMSFLLVLESLASIAAGVLVSKIIDEATANFTIKLAPLLTMIGCVILASPQFGFIGLMVIGFADSLFYVLSNEKINNEITSNIRASFISFSSLCFSLVMIIYFPLFGFLAQTISFLLAFIFQLVLCVIFIGYYYHQTNKLKV